MRISELNKETAAVSLPNGPCSTATKVVKKTFDFRFHHHFSNRSLAIPVISWYPKILTRNFVVQQALLILCQDQAQQQLHETGSRWTVIAIVNTLGSLSRRALELSLTAHSVTIL